MDHDLAVAAKCRRDALCDLLERVELRCLDTPRPLSFHFNTYLSYHISIKLQSFFKNYFSDSKFLFDIVHTYDMIEEDYFIVGG
ncbi:MAG: hypothetical protein E7422_01685 [Ruminococcaceae bacterium]|nr:hypothetical protein [Oscillospiraceae bacterium]